MCGFVLSTTSIGNIFHSKQNAARYCHKCTHVFMRSTRYSCHILTRLEISRQIFEKYSVSNFTKIRPMRAEFFYAEGQTDGRTGTSTLLVAFLHLCERV